MDSLGKSFHGFCPRELMRMLHQNKGELQEDLEPWRKGIQHCRDGNGHTSTTMVQEIQ